MSGGAFQYNQYKIGEIADSIEDIINKNNIQKPKEERHYLDSEYYYDFSDEVIEKFKEGLNILRKAQVYAQRIDWLVSYDDSEESFFERLEEDLKQIQ